MMYYQRIEVVIAYRPSTARSAVRSWATEPYINMSRHFGKIVTPSLPLYKTVTNLALTLPKYSKTADYRPHQGRIQDFLVEGGDECGSTSLIGGPGA